MGHSTLTVHKPQSIAGKHETFCETILMIMYRGKIDGKSFVGDIFREYLSGNEISRHTLFWRCPSVSSIRAIVSWVS